MFLFYQLYTSALFGTAKSLHYQKSHTANASLYQTASIPSSMLRKSNFVFIVYILVSFGLANGKKPQNGKTNNSVLGNKPPQPMDQTFNINNWGLGKVDRKLLTDMKYKIESLYKKSQGPSQGKY